MFVSQNFTPFLAESYVATDKAGIKALVVVVRATFGVASDGTASVSELQTPFVFADKHYGDPETTSVQFESDFVPVKPRADVLLAANAIAQNGTPVGELEVSLLGPGLQKRAVVMGERHWTVGVLGMQATPPRPFLSMPLAWHLTFGGSDQSDDDPGNYRSDLRNPIGSGFHVNASAKTIEGVPLPCIERPNSRMRSWNDTPEPIAFGPVPRFAQSRVRFAGTYDNDWLDNVLPFLPADFDTRYFQAAPEDQQLDSLPPGATFTCVNMSREGTFVVRLPVVSVAAKFLLDDKTVVRLVRPDTLILEPHERRIVMLGRTSMDLPRKFTRVREVVVETVHPKMSPPKTHYKSLADIVRRPSSEGDN